MHSKLKAVGRFLCDWRVYLPVAFLVGLKVLSFYHGGDYARALPSKVDGLLILFGLGMSAFLVVWALLDHRFNTSRTWAEEWEGMFIGDERARMLNRLAIAGMFIAMAILASAFAKALINPFVS